LGGRLLPPPRPAATAAPTGPQPVAAGSRLLAPTPQGGPAGRSGVVLAVAGRLVPRTRLALRLAFAEPDQGARRRRGRALGPGIGAADGHTLAGGGGGVQEGGLARGERGGDLGAGHERAVAAADRPAGEFAALPDVRQAHVA